MQCDNRKCQNFHHLAWELCPLCKTGSVPCYKCGRPASPDTNLCQECLEPEYAPLRPFSEPELAMLDYLKG